MKIIEKDILIVERGIICQQVNCMGVMGAGLAKKIKEKWSIVANEYNQKCYTYRGREDRLIGAGAVTVVDIDKKLYVACLYGQMTFGRDPNTCYTNYEKLEEALDTVAEASPLIAENLQIYVPYLLGCGLANGKWETVESIIRRIEEKHKIEIIACRLP